MFDPSATSNPVRWPRRGHTCRSATGRLTTRRLTRGRSGRASVRTVGSCLLASLTLVIGFLTGQPAAAAPAAVAGDVEITNHSFESGVENWTASGSGCALTTTTRWSTEGGRSLKLRTEDTCEAAGALSDPQPIRPGTTSYTAFATVQSRSASGIGLRFLDDAGTEVGRAESELTEPQAPREWREGRQLQRTAEVPDGATQVQAEIAASGETNADEVLITAAMTALGAQITKAASYLAAEVGVDADGGPVIFSVATGADSVAPQLVVTDAITRKVRTTVDVPGATGAWTVRQDPATSTVYVGTYGEPALYAWQPGDAEVTKIGSLPIDGAGMVYGIDHARDGRIYGGTWGEPANGYPGAQMWTYAPESGLEKFGPVLTTDAFYTKAVAYEDSSGTVWAGTATKGHLYGCTEDEKCTDFTSLLGPKTREHIGVYNMVANDGYVMAWGGESSSTGDDEITVIKVDVVDGLIKAEQVAVIDGTVYHGASDVHDGKIYYMKSADAWPMPMYSYDLTTGKETALDVDLGMSSRRWRIVELNDSDWPGSTLVGWSTNGTVYRFNLSTGSFDEQKATGQPEMPTGLNSLAAGPDGRVWSNGYLTGGIAAVEPMRSSSVEVFSYGGQAESTINYRGRIYQGTYPSGSIRSFAPKELGDSAPRVECEIGSSQNRPYGLAGHGDRVYFGSQADYGTDVGAFGWLDLTTGECTTLSEEVGHYSVNEIAASGNRVYGATNIFVAYDSVPVETEAKLLIFDEDTQKLRLEPLPVPGIRSIDALTTAPDGTVWAYANGWVFVIDPETDEIVLSEHLYPDQKPGDRISGSYADLITGPDGMLYGRVGNRIFTIDPTRALADESVDSASKIIVEGIGQKDLTVDRYGNLYTISGDQVFRIDPRGDLSGG